MEPRSNIREAIKILMLSPIYFRLNTKDRMSLINEFCRLHMGIAVNKASTRLSH